MANNNEVRITGNLGKDAEFRPSVGNGLATFSLAYNRYRPTEDGYAKMPTNWFRCVAWGKLADKVARLKKGDRVAVVGRLESREWEDTKGVKHSAIEIVVESISLAAAIKDQEVQEGVATKDYEDDVPLTRPVAQSSNRPGTKKPASTSGKKAAPSRKNAASKQVA